MTLQTKEEKIKQRRAQMLIHSYIYYHLDDNIVDDHTWQKWADELTELQAGEVVEIGFYDKEFADWDGSTGSHLPKDAWVHEKAIFLLSCKNKPLAHP